MTEAESQKVDFSGLVAGVAASAIAVMSQVEMILDPTAASAAGGAEEGEGETLSTEELRKRASDGLAGARQLIDTLAVLEEKTQGNLTDDEGQLLQAALSDLRIRYVSLANRPFTEAKKGEGEAG
jgi:hypothetical protein